MADSIEVFTQSSIRIRNDIGTIYIDPFQMMEEPRDADFVFITHEHYDHYSPEDIKKVAGEETVFVIPESMKNKVGEISDLISRAEWVKPGEAYETEGLQYETVPAYNTIKPFHPKSAAWVGYVLKLNGKRIYIAGDTDATKEAEAVKCDIALVPIGGTYTMDAKKAAALINEISPETAIPTHYGSIVGKQEDEDTFAGNVKEPVKVECKIHF
ncbi:MAG: MBL fold metallo-hydrolase [Lachnospiraceae bacterium]|nr:MBL fold metallo-hydrolase [Lachnospiraceae bacterium]